MGYWYIRIDKVKQEQVREGRGIMRRASESGTMAGVQRRGLLDRTVSG